MTRESEQLSTSALAKRLKLPIQQLFMTLRDYAWIERQGNGWVLTAKGELHGGSYRDSQRFGRYIVWPETLVEHPLIAAIESNQRITPGGMCRYYPHLSARQINRTLAELGFQRRSSGGVQLTALGASFGGRQELDDEYALSVISWPHELVDDPVVHRELARLAGDGDDLGASGAQESGLAAGAKPMDDLFASATETAAAGDAARGVGPTRRQTLDGHLVDSLLQRRVCDWLYEAQLAHARNRRLPVDEDLSADFYVPAAGLYIECWEREVPTLELTRRLRTREVCRERQLAYQEIAAADMPRIDELLTERLRELGLHC